MAKYRAIDFDKVQKDYLARLLKGDKSWSYTYNNEKYAITDGHFMAIMPRPFCFLSYDNSEMHWISPDCINSFTKAAEGTMPAYDTQTERVIADGKKVHIFQLEDNTEVAIDPNYLKYFSGMSVHYSGTANNAPIFVHALDMVVGLILPIKIK